MPTRAAWRNAEPASSADAASKPSRNKILTRTITDRSKSNAPVHDHFTAGMQEVFIRRRYSKYLCETQFLVGKTRERLRFEFLEFSEKILATSYLATVVESDEIGFS